MEITVSNQRGTVPVTVVQPHGDVDASNFSQLISKVQALQSEGVQDFILDLSDVPFMSSAGLVALHSIANMLRGEKVADPQAGWAALKSIDRSRESGIQQHVKLLSPQPYVLETFDKAGFTQFFEIFTDLKKAVDSF
ncbi:MAG TPA: STAS domain-containing protein [Anaerolineales bacterium]|nr:STAS domain-containing protein [Anaerolineales bacterium]